NISEVIFNKRYDGHYFDKESGLNYNVNRSYSPAMGGRYTQPDPMGLSAGWNQFVYVDGNPLSFIDPDGLQQRATPRKPLDLQPLDAGGGSGIGGGGGGGSARWSPPCPPIAKGITGRSGALGEAKRDLGVPRTQHPDSVSRVPMTDQNGKSVLGLDGKPIMTREYTYTRPDGTNAVVQDHGAGHQFRQGGVGDQGPHFNVRPPENTRGGSIPGTKDHYSW
ncbi:HNH/endonuclease VII fold putative polymorphic toxin, partial [Variovorax sp. KK3]